MIESYLYIIQPSHLHYGTSFYHSTRRSASKEVRTYLPLDFGISESREDTNDYNDEISLPQTCGVSIVGSQPYVTNFNVVVNGASLELCKETANSVRNAFGVQIMALPHINGHEIGCNLQASNDHCSPDRDEIVQYIRASLPENVSIERSYVVGLTVDEAIEKSKLLLLDD